MKDISIYFNPVELDLPQGEFTIGGQLFQNNEKGFPDIEKGGVAIFDVPEYRNGNAELSNDSDAFRSKFYALHSGDNWAKEIYDLGTIIPGEKIEDTYFAVAQTFSELLKKDIIPVIIGGSMDLSIACYKGYEVLEQMVNFCSVSSSLNIGDPAESVSANGYVSHLLMQRPCYLFNYATIGLQRPYAKKYEMDLVDKLYFDVCRLGQFNADFKKSEPLLRNSDFIAIDYSAVKGSEVDGEHYVSPNGFRADQLCQIARYAGVSDKITSFGVFNVDRGHGPISASLLSELIWYFIDGLTDRVGDFPIGTKKYYKKFHVHLDDFQDDLVFYKSERSGRWWLEVQYLMRDNLKFKRHCMVPCDEADYNNALEDVVPNLWWKTLQKMS